MKTKTISRTKPGRAPRIEARKESASVDARIGRAPGNSPATTLRGEVRVRAPGTSLTARALRKSPAAPPSKIILRLFVAGTTPRSRQAILCARELCRGKPHDACELEVIDIYQQPKLARDHQIVATPTLIKEFPRPVRRFIGNLLNTAGLYLELNLVKKDDVPL